MMAVFGTALWLVAWAATGAATGATDNCYLERDAERVCVERETASFAINSTQRWPTVLGIGPAKSGSTITADMMHWTGKVLLGSMGCCRGETMFLSKESEYRKGLRHYASFFEPVTTEGVVAFYDKTPLYDVDFLVPFRALAFLGPSLKLVFTMRNPVDMDASQYFQYQIPKTQTLYVDWVRRRMDKHTAIATCRSERFQELLAAESRDQEPLELRDLYDASKFSLTEVNFFENYLARKCPDPRDHDAMLGTSLFAANLRRWLRVFPDRGQLLCNSNEDLLSDSAAVRERLFAFVGIPYDHVEPLTTNSSYDANRTLNRLVVASERVLLESSVSSSKRRHLRRSADDTGAVVESILATQRKLVTFLAAYTSCQDVQLLTDACGPDYTPHYDIFARCQLP